ncbi:hypothetical protein [Enterovibrio norvegicus]|uniref:hypothetical protein n=1 Tax=Enterovibrio norvegicus TaxID=188144 RepID=UPI00354B5013
MAIVVFASIVTTYFYAVKPKLNQIQFAENLGLLLIPLAFGLPLVFELKIKLRLVITLIPLILAFSCKFYVLKSTALDCSSQQFQSSVQKYLSIVLDSLKQTQEFKALFEGLQAKPPYPDMTEKELIDFTHNLYAEIKSLDYLCTE